MDYEQLVKNYLLEMGFRPNIKGYRLLSRLLVLGMKGENIMPLKYEGYVRVAKEFGVAGETIEKDIQNAISAAWLRGDVDKQYGAFGETLDENKGKPTNKQFMLTALDELKRTADIV